MLDAIRGLHHVTSIAGDPAANNRFFTHVLGLRRVKQTVNFDAPEVYHLYYGDALGRPGTVMTHFPFPGARPGREGTGEVSRTLLSVPPGAIGAWQARFAEHGVASEETSAFGERRLHFRSNDEEDFALVEREDARNPWTGEVGADVAIRGFHGVSMRLADEGATRELMQGMGYREIGREGDVTRFAVAGETTGADVVEIETAPAHPAEQGAGSVHHVAFSVADRAAQAAVRDELTQQGFAVTPVIDRDYFWSIYFRTPGGVLFEVATEEPGFDRDEDREHLGETLKLPSQHEHMRDFLEEHLQPLDAAA